MKKLFVLVGAALLLAACSAAPTDIPTATAIPPTATIAPTATPAPTNTPAPTATPAPTNTRKPTFTPRPTLTPSPVPTPIVLEGSGDGVIDADTTLCPCILEVEGNQSSRHFAVENFDASGNQIDLLVNTTDAYVGRVPIDFLDSEKTARFQITARGAWKLTLFPLSIYLDYRGRNITPPGKITGAGDDIVILLGSKKPDLAKVSGNQASRFFAVIAWGLNGRDLLINTTDAYDGTVIMPADALILEIKADGDWSVEITTK